MTVAAADNRPIAVVQVVLRQEAEVSCCDQHRKPARSYWCAETLPVDCFGRALGVGALHRVIPNLPTGLPPDVPAIGTQCPDQATAQMEAVAIATRLQSWGWQVRPIGFQIVGELQPKSADGAS